VNKNFLRKKNNYENQFIYPSMTSSGIITIIVTIIIMYTIIRRKNKNKNIRRPIVIIENNPTNRMSQDQY